MFDVILRNDVAGVPVPLPGRGVLFAGADGLWRTRLPDGSVVTNQGLPGIALMGYTGAATNATATAVLCLAPVDFASFLAGGGGLSFQVRGDATNGTTAATLNVSVRTNGVVRATAAVALGTVAFTNRGWVADGSLSVFQGNALVDITLAVAGLAPVKAAPVPFAVTGAQKVDIVFALSAAVAGVSVRSHLGRAMQLFSGGVV